MQTLKNKFLFCRKSNLIDAKAMITHWFPPLFVCVVELATSVALELPLWAGGAAAGAAASNEDDGDARWSQTDVQSADGADRDRSCAEEGEEVEEGERDLCSFSLAWVHGGDLDGDGIVVVHGPAVPLHPIPAAAPARRSG